MSSRAVSLARGAVLGGAVGLAASAVATAAASALAAGFARQVVTPVRERPDDVDVLAVDVAAATVTLRAAASATAPGRYGLDAGAVHAQVGEVLGTAGRPGRGGGRHTVTRALLDVRGGELAPGPACWSGAFHAGDPTSALGLPHQEVLVRSDVGDLPAWWVPPAAASARADVWAVLVHGRGSTREECLRALPLLHRLGVPALVPSYRNDADAPASPDGRYGLGDTEWVDLEAAVLHALDAGARGVVVLAWSMGAAIALSALSRSWTADRVRALVLDGPVLDWRHVLDHHARLHHLPRPLARWGLAMLGSPLARSVVGVDAPVDLRRMDWVARAQELSTPMLLLHGDDDDFVPSGPTVALAAARPDLVTHLAFPGAGHCREWNVDPDRWEREVARFLLDHL